jgi:hypothetical protein
LKFKEVNSYTAAWAYRQWHYLKDQGFIHQISFGAFFELRVEGAITYGPPNAKNLSGFFTDETQAGWWEIKRLVLSPKCPKNSESRFIAITIKMLRALTKVQGIVTYADDSQGHKGTIYKASGFKALGLTAQKSDFWIDEKPKQRGVVKGLEGEWKPRSRKWLFVKDFR